MKLRNMLKIAAVVATVLTVVVPGSVTQASILDTKDVKEIIKRAEKNDAASQLKLSLIYLSESKTKAPENLKKSVQWLTRASDAGNTDAITLLGAYYIDGLGVKKDVAKAVELFSKSAKSGDATAQYWLGKLSEAGLGTEKNLNRAFDYYMLAAEKGVADAQLRLSISYDDGSLTSVNATKSVYWAMRASESGNPVAQFLLWSHYNNGSGVEVDPVRALYWLMRSSESAYAPAQYELAMHLLSGVLPKDLKYVQQLLTSSAMQGYAEARYTLAVLYLSEIGKQVYGTEDTAALRSAQLFATAAQDGHSGAITLLGELFEKGIGIKKNEEVAYALALIASKTGNERAKKDLDKYKKSFSKKVRRAGEKKSKLPLKDIVKAVPHV